MDRRAPPPSSYSRDFVDIVPLREFPRVFDVRILEDFLRDNDDTRFRDHYTNTYMLNNYLDNIVNELVADYTRLVETPNKGFKIR